MPDEIENGSGSSRFEDGCYSSLTGIALIAKVLKGNRMITYTKAEVGDGFIPDDKTPQTMTECAVQSRKIRAEISSITNPVDGECQITVQVQSDNVEHGFFATNVVLFAEDPDEGEVAFTYLCMEKGPQWIRPKSSIVGQFITFDIIAAVGEAERVEAVVNPDALMTRAEVEKLITEATALSITELFIPKNGWIKNTTAREVEAGYGFYQDINIAGIHHTQFPVMSLHKEAFMIEGITDLCPTVQTFDGKIRVWSKSKIAGDIDASLALYDLRSSVIESRITISVAENKWKSVDNLQTATYPIFQDVLVAKATPDRFPIVSLDIQSLKLAQIAGLCPTVQALDGKLRFWALRIPNADLHATAAFLFQASGKGQTNELFIASADTLGGVKVKEGSGLKVNDEGYLSLDAALPAEVRSLFN